MIIIYPVISLTELIITFIFFIFGAIVMMLIYHSIIALVRLIKFTTFWAIAGIVALIRLPYRIIKYYVARRRREKCNAKKKS